MHIDIVAVGRFKRGPEAALYERYVARCPWRIDLHEVVLKKAVAATQVRAAESRLLAEHLDGSRPVVVLDERGRLPASADIAATLGRWRDDARGGARFVIGGADGVDDELRGRADAVWAFGRLTWPHLMVRALLAEQLYRAASLLAGHPYHRGD